jgi:phage/plasmid-associated DNA primase
MDVFQTFIDDRCDVSASAKEGSQAMYDAYTHWCASAGIRLPLKQASFNQRLEERGFVRKKTASQNLWLGVGLKPFVPTAASYDVPPGAAGDLSFGY